MKFKFTKKSNLSPEQTANKRKKFRTISISTASLALALVAVLLINLICTNLTERYDLTLDLTASKLYEITDDTKDMLKHMKKPVEITILAKEDDFKHDPYFSSVHTLLNKYNNLAGDKLTIEYIDPYTNPNVVDKYSGVVASIRASSVIVSCEDNIRVLNDTDFYATEADPSHSGYAMATGFQGEQALTSAITTVTNEETPAAYILQGHNESVSKSFTSMLTNAGFSVDLLNLTEKKEIPNDAAMIILSLPQADITESDADMLDAFIKRGGDLIVFDGTVCPTSMPVLYSYLKEWGVSVQADMVLDAKYNISTPADTLAQLTDNKANNGLQGNDLSLIAPNAKSIHAELPASVNDRTIDVLMESRDTSYAKILTDETKYDDFNQTEQDTDGPFPLATLSAYTGNNKGGQVFVCSSGIMMSDDLMGASSLLNHSFLSNVIRQMQPELDVVSIPAKNLRAEPLIISSTAQFIVFLLIAFIPFGMLLAGVIVFVRRRKL